MVERVLTNFDQRGKMRLKVRNGQTRPFASYQYQQEEEVVHLCSFRKLEA